MPFYTSFNTISLELEKISRSDRWCSFQFFFQFHIRKFKKFHFIFTLINSKYPSVTWPCICKFSYGNNLTEDWNLPAQVLQIFLNFTSNEGNIPYVSPLWTHVMLYVPFQTDKRKIVCLNVQEVAAFIANRYHDEKLYSVQAILSKLLGTCVY